MTDAPTTETVDTPAAESTAPVTLGLPSPADLPRDEAQESALMAERVLSVVQVAFASGIPFDVDASADARRRLAVLADLTAKRDLSKAATRDMLTALRITERALGLAMRGIPGIKWRDYLPDERAAFRCSALADVDQEEFDAAIHAWRRPGGFASFESLLEIIRGNTPDNGELDTAAVEDQSVLSAEDVEATVTEALDHLRVTARILRGITADQIGQLRPELASDWARRVWTDAVPVLVTRKNLLERGGQ